MRGFCTFDICTAGIYLSFYPFFFFSWFIKSMFAKRRKKKLELKVDWNHIWKSLAFEFSVASVRKVYICYSKYSSSLKGTFSVSYSIVLFFFSVYFPGEQHLKVVFVIILLTEASSRMHTAVLFLQAWLYFEKGDEKSIFLLTLQGQNPGVTNTHYPQDNYSY